MAESKTFAFLDVELYKEGETFGAYISDNVGGSGISVKGATPEEVASNLSPYLADYFYEQTDDSNEQ